MAKLILSHTRKDMYTLCARKYKLHYIDNIREATIGSALVLGTSIDLGLNRLLLGKSLEDANKAFIDAFSYQVINGDKVYVPESDKVTYFKKDLNPLLIKEGEPIHPWYSLKNLGLMMLEAYQREVIPRIQKVHFIQKQIMVQSDTDDVIGGVADFGATIDNIKKVVVDNKTASKRYPKDSVKTSPQLALYQFALNADKAAYVVLVKDPLKKSVKVCATCNASHIDSKIKTCNGILKDSKKRCNGILKDTISLSIDIQVIIDDVSLDTTEKTIEEYSNLSYNIKMENFEPDFSKCSNQWGRRCAMFDYCRNGSMEGLVKKNV